MQRSALAGMLRGFSERSQWMNAPVTVALPTELFKTDRVSAFLAGLSLEITPRQIDKLPILAGRLPPASKVYIALIDPADVAGQLEAAVRLRALGLEPVPHLPARFIRDETDLDMRIGALAERAGVRQALVL